MSEFQPSCQNVTPGLFNRSWSGWHHYQMIGAAETIILPSLIWIICSTGLIGNNLIVFTIIRTQKKTIPDIYICNLAIANLVHIIGMPFPIHQWARGGEWVFDSPLCTIITSLDTCNQFTCSAIMTTMRQVYTLSYYNNFLFSFTTDIYLLHFNFMLHMRDESANQESRKNPCSQDSLRRVFNPERAQCWSHYNDCKEELGACPGCVLIHFKRGRRRSACCQH